MSVNITSIGSKMGFLAWLLVASSNSSILDTPEKIQNLGQRDIWNIINDQCTVQRQFIPNPDTPESQDPNQTDIPMIRIQRRSRPLDVAAFFIGDSFYDAYDMTVAVDEQGNPLAELEYVDGAYKIVGANGKVPFETTESDPNPGSLSNLQDYKGNRVVTDCEAWFSVAMVVSSQVQTTIPISDDASEVLEDICTRIRQETNKSSQTIANINSVLATNAPVIEDEFTLWACPTESSTSSPQSRAIPPSAFDGQLKLRTVKPKAPTARNLPLNYAGILMAGVGIAAVVAIAYKIHKKRESRSVVYRLH
jgi:hypothetical protein